MNSIEQMTLLQQLGRSYRAFLAAYEKDVGHYLGRWAVLLRLYQVDAPCSQRQLGDAVHMDPGSLSRQLGALESLGWIVREIDQNDKRHMQVALTEAGREQVEAGLPKRAVFIERILGRLPDGHMQRMVDDLMLLEAVLTANDVPPPGSSSR